MNPPPPLSNTLIFERLNQLLIWWHTRCKKFPKSDRYVIGQKVFTLLLDVLTLVVEIEHLPRERKKEKLIRLSTPFDQIKILVRLSKALDILSEKEYIAVQKLLDEIGRMLGGWIKSLP